MVRLAICVCGWDRESMPEPFVPFAVRRMINALILRGNNEVTVSA